MGMSNRHSWIRQYSLGEFALEQERIHRDMLRDHLKEEKLNSIKLKVDSVPQGTKGFCFPLCYNDKNTSRPQFLSLVRLLLCPGVLS